MVFWPFCLQASPKACRSQLSFLLGLICMPVGEGFQVLSCHQYKKNYLEYGGGWMSDQRLAEITTNSQSERTLSKKGQLGLLEGGTPCSGHWCYSREQAESPCSRGPDIPVHKGQ